MNFRFGFAIFAFLLTLCASLESSSADPLRMGRNPLRASVPNFKFDAEVPATLKTQILQDLSFLSSVTGSAPTPLHGQIFGKVDGPSYMTWLKSRVNQVGVSLCGGDNAVACVLSAWENKMWFTPNYTAFNQPQIARLSVIYHEARHTEAENDFWPHATCPKPFLDEGGKEIVSIWTGVSLAGISACDLTELGSYGVQTIFLKNIAEKCTNCTQKVRADADLFANDQLNRIIWPEAKTKMKRDFGMNEWLGSK